MKSFTARWLKPYFGGIALFVFCTILAVLFTMATALSVADFLRLLFEGNATNLSIATTTAVTPIEKAEEALYCRLLQYGPQTALWLFSLLLLVVYGAKNVFSYFAAVKSSVIRAQVVADLRKSLHNKYLHLPVSRTDGQSKGDLLSRISNDVAEYEMSTLVSLQQIVSSIVAMLLYIVMLFYLSTKLTLAVLAMLPIVVFVISGLSHKLKRQSLKAQNLHADMLSMVSETLSGAKEIRSYVSEDYCQKRFCDLDQSYRRERINMFRRIYAASPVSDTLGNCIVAAILLVGAYLVFDGTSGLSAELFISYLMMVVLLLPPSKELTTAIATLKKGAACADRVEAMLLEPEDAQISQGKTFEGLREGIEMKHLTFGYQSTPVLRDICCSIPRGKLVAVVGTSGSGKSTLVDVLSCQYPYEKGNILVDGDELSSLRRDHWWSHIGVVGQRSQLFAGTVAENIALGRPDSSFKEICHAAEASGAIDFISALPKGFDSPIGENGSLLSGGQRQRLLIARALLGNPDFLIFDEATSALDSETEQIVQHTIEQLSKERTILLIAHRLSTVVSADIIYVLENGEIVEQGTHKTLLEQGGRYSELCRLQQIK